MFTLVNFRMDFNEYKKRLKNYLYFYSLILTYLLLQKIPLQFMKNLKWNC